MERTSDFRNLTRKKGGKDQQINFIFQSTKYARKSLFIENAFEINEEIQKLNQIILKTRKNYLDILHFSISQKSPLTDEMKDHFEQKCTSKLTLIHNKITKLKNQLSSSNNEEKDSFENKKGILMFLLKKTDEVNALLQNLRKMRMKQISTADYFVKMRISSDVRVRFDEDNDENDHFSINKIKKRGIISPSITAISNISSKIPFSPISSLSSPQLINSPKELIYENKNINNNHHLSTINVNNNNKNDFNINNANDNKNNNYNYLEDENKNQNFIQLTKEEIQIFEKEQKEMYSELESMTDHITVIEKQIIDIGQLQDQFSSKVSEQAEEIENLHQITVESSSHISIAKQNLQSIVNDNSDFRLFTVVLIVCLSFGLLFIHFYD